MFVEFSRLNDHWTSPHTSVTEGESSKPRLLSFRGQISFLFYSSTSERESVCWKAKDFFFPKFS